MKEPLSTRLTPALVRAARILDLVAGSDGPIAVTRIGAELDIPRNSVYELVRTLSAYGFLALDGDGKVTLGLHLFELGNAYTRSLDLMSAAAPIIREMASASGETCHLAVLEGRHVVYLVKTEGKQSLRVLSSLGGRMPAHATAVGKAVLAFLPDADASRRLTMERLEKLTPATETDPTVLLGQLRQTRHLGVAFDNEESTPGVCCVGAPIHGSSGKVVAGISIAVPCFRMTAKRRIELAGLVQDSARELSRSLGYVEGQVIGSQVPR